MPIPTNYSWFHRLFWEIVSIILAFSLKSSRIIIESKNIYLKRNFPNNNSEYDVLIYNK